QNNQKFHQVFVHRRASRLHDKDGAPTHVLIDFDLRFPIWEVAERNLPERILQLARDFLGQLEVGPTAEHLEFRRIRLRSIHSATISKGREPQAEPLGHYGGLMKSMSTMIAERSRGLLSW